MSFVTATPSLERLLQKHVFDHCHDLAHWSEVLFVATFAVISVVLSAAAEFALSPFAGSTPTPQWLSQGLIFIVLVALFVGPVLETLLLQQLPISIARRFGASPLLQFLAGSVPFAILHFEAGVVSGVAAGVIGGPILSLAYLTFLPQSRSKAFVVTTAIHSLHNVLPIAMVVRELG